MQLSKIVVPTDFSEYSFSALHYAMDLAEKWDAEIFLVYVLEDVPSFLDSDDPDNSKEKFLHSNEEAAGKKIIEIAGNYGEESGIKITPILRTGINHDQILKFAGEIEADLIVIATHGRTGILYTLLGSVAEKVIQFAKCPVLVVKPEEES